MENKNNSWTQEDEALLYSLRQEGIPYSSVAVGLNRTIDSCKAKYKNTTWQNKQFFDVARNQLKENIKAQINAKIIDARDKAIELSATKTDILIDKMCDSIKALPTVSKSIYTPNKKNIKQSHSPEDVGLCLSDTHIGHNHTLEETNGISEYNIDIFKKRCEFLKTATSDIVELHSKLYDLPNLHIFCLGDIVAGMNDVGEWSATYINLTILDQVIAGLDAISDMINYWLGLFENIYFYGVGGNHGRCSSKGIEKDYVNWDHVTYMFLQERFANNPRVHFNIPKCWYIMTEVRNHKFLLVHGDDMKGRGDGVVYGALKYLEKMYGILNEIPHYILTAHYHSAAELTTNNGRVIVNGGFIGPDIYAFKSLQRSSKPEQKIFGIHDKRGIPPVHSP